MKGAVLKSQHASYGTSSRVLHRRCRSLAFTFTTVTPSLPSNAANNSALAIVGAAIVDARNSGGWGDGIAILSHSALSPIHALCPFHHSTLLLSHLSFLIPNSSNMAEVARLIGMLRASAGQNANIEKPLFTEPTTRKPKAEPKGIQHVLCLLRSSAARESAAPKSRTRPPSNASDIKNDLAVANCRRIFAARADVKKLYTIAISVQAPPLSPTMAGRFPVLSTSNLPPASASEQSATASPARGSAMLNSIFKSVRVPEFRFRWMFWAEKGQQSGPKDKTTQSEDYASRPKPLGEQIISIKEFYQHFNNIPVENLKLRDSIHLFHMGVKPVWEDPRNERGGAWYFKVSKDVAPQFWHELCLLAVGDVLQGAVETKRACK